MKNTEKLYNFLKIELQQNETLNNLYIKQINSLIEFYEMDMKRMQLFTKEEIYNYLENILLVEKETYDRLLTDEEEHQLATLYFAHTTVVALEHLLSRIDYI